MTDAKVIRFAAVLIVLAGYAFVFRSGEARVHDELASNAHVAEQLRDGERTLEARTALVAERGRLRAQLHLADFAADRSALVARFVRDAAAIASHQHCTITAIVASGTAPGTASAGAPPAASGTAPLTVSGTALAVSRDAASGIDTAFEDIPAEITVEGRYANVLATIRALSAGRVLASVDVTSLARKNAAAADATLTATLRVVLERVAPLPAKGWSGAQPRPV